MDTLPQTHPVPHHRKIDLQSPADLQHLQTLLARSARAKLDKHLPPHVPPATHISLGGAHSNSPNDTLSESEAEDDLRRAVRQLIDSFLLQTWTSAAENIAVNGLDAPTPQNIPSCTNPESEQVQDSEEREGVHFAYATFDPRLQRRVAALHGEVEGLTARVAALRREAPARAAGEYTDALRGALEQDERAWGTLQDSSTESTGLVLEQPKLGWVDTREMFERGVSELALLSGTGGGGSGLTETVGRGQRAGRVAMELE